MPEPNRPQQPSPSDLMHGLKATHGLTRTVDSKADQILELLEPGDGPSPILEMLGEILAEMAALRQEVTTLRRHLDTALGPRQLN